MAREIPCEILDRCLTMEPHSCCQNCRYWKVLGHSIAQRRIVHDNRVIVIESGPEGQCRGTTPIADNRWALTMAGDWCRHFASKTLTAPPVDAPAAEKLDPATAAPSTGEANPSAPSLPSPATPKPDSGTSTPEPSPSRGRRR